MDGDVCAKSDWEAEPKALLACELDTIVAYVEWMVMPVPNHTGNQNSCCGTCCVDVQVREDSESQEVGICVNTGIN